MINYIKRSLDENARARSDLVDELRNQISKLEVRIKRYEDRWEKFYV